MSPGILLWLPSRASAISASCALWGTEVLVLLLETNSCTLGPLEPAQEAPPIATELPLKRAYPCKNLSAHVCTAVARGSQRRNSLASKANFHGDGRLRVRSRKVRQATASAHIASTSAAPLLSATAVQSAAGDLRSHMGIVLTATSRTSVPLLLLIILLICSSCLPSASSLHSLEGVQSESPTFDEPAGVELSITQVQGGTTR